MMTKQSFGLLSAYHAEAILTWIVYIVVCQHVGLLLRVFLGGGNLLISAHQAMRAFTNAGRQAGFAAAALLIGFVSFMRVSLFDAACVLHGQAAASNDLVSAAAVSNNDQDWHAVCHSQPFQHSLACGDRDCFSSCHFVAPALQNGAMLHGSRSSSSAKGYHPYFNFVRHLSHHSVGREAGGSLWHHAHVLYAHAVVCGPRLLTAAVAVHASDAALALVLMVPQLLVAALLAEVLMSRQRQLQTWAGPDPARQDLPADRSVMAAAGNISSPASIYSSTTSHKQTWLLAAVKLIPATAGLVVSALGQLGLALHPASSSQYLLLCHWSTPVLMGSLTLLSQAKRKHKVAVAILHTLLATGVLALGASSIAGEQVGLLASSADDDAGFARAAGMQSVLLLLLLDVVLCPLVLYAWQIFTERSSSRRSQELGNSVHSAEQGDAASSIVSTVEGTAAGMNDRQQASVTPPEQCTYPAQHKSLPAKLADKEPGTASVIIKTGTVHVPHGYHLLETAHSHSPAAEAGDESSSMQGDSFSSLTVSLQQRGTQHEVASSSGSGNDMPGVAVQLHTGAITPQAARASLKECRATNSEGSATDKTATPSEVPRGTGMNAIMQERDQKSQYTTAAAPAGSGTHAVMNPPSAATSEAVLQRLSSTAAAVPGTQQQLTKPHASSSYTAAAAVDAASPHHLHLLGLPPAQQQLVVQQQLEQLQQLPAVQRPGGPAISFGDALAAVQRGAAAGNSQSLGRRALYRSPVQHHVISLKVPLAHAQHGQELAALLSEQFGAATSAATASVGVSAAPAGPSTSSPIDMIMLPPVAVRGCFHLLLPIAVPHGTASMFSMPIRQLLNRLTAGATHSGAAGSRSQGGNSATAGGGLRHQHLDLDERGEDSTDLPKIILQIDGHEPVLVARQRGGAWTVAGSASSNAAAAAAGDPLAAAVTEHIDQPPLSANGCCVNPPCVLLPTTAARDIGAGSSSSASKVTGVAAAHKQAEKVQITVNGLPAAAGPAVRIVLAQGSHLVTDQVVPLQRQQQTPENARTTASLEVVCGVLHPGPAVMYVLSAMPPTAARPSHSTAAAGSRFATAREPNAAAPALGPMAAGSIAASTQAGSTNSGDNGELSCLIVPNSGTLWACLPVLGVADAAAHRQLLALFEGMAEEVQQQQHQPRKHDECTGRVSADGGSSGICTPPTPTLSDDELILPATGSSAAAATDSYCRSDVHTFLHLHHWQPMLWDWLYATYATDSSCTRQIAAMAAALRNNPALQSGTSIITTETAAATRATATDTAPTSSSKLQDVKTTLASELLCLLAGRGLKHAAQELLSHLAAAAAVSGAARSNDGTAATALANAAKELLPASTNRGYRDRSMGSLGEAHPLSSNAGSSVDYTPMAARSAAVGSINAAWQRHSFDGGKHSSVSDSSSSITRGSASSLLPGATGQVQHRAEGWRHSVPTMYGCMSAGYLESVSTGKQAGSAAASQAATQGTQSTLAEGSVGSQMTNLHSSTGTGPAAAGSSGSSTGKNQARNATSLPAAPASDVGQYMGSMYASAAGAAGNVRRRAASFDGQAASGSSSFITGTGRSPAVEAPISEMRCRAASIDGSGRSNASAGFDGHSSNVSYALPVPASGAGADAASHAGPAAAGPAAAGSSDRPAARNRGLRKHHTLGELDMTNRHRSAVSADVGVQAAAARTSAGTASWPSLQSIPATLAGGSSAPPPSAAASTQGGQHVAAAVDSLNGSGSTSIRPSPALHLSTIQSSHFSPAPAVNLHGASSSSRLASPALHLSDLQTLLHRPATTGAVMDSTCASAGKRASSAMQLSNLQHITAGMHNLQLFPQQSPAYHPHQQMHQVAPMTASNRSAAHDIDNDISSSDEFVTAAGFSSANLSNWSEQQQHQQQQQRDLVEEWPATTSFGKLSAPVNAADAAAQLLRDRPASHAASPSAHVSVPAATAGVPAAALAQQLLQASRPGPRMPSPSAAVQPAVTSATAPRTLGGTRSPLAAALNDVSSSRQSPRSAGLTGQLPAMQAADTASGLGGGGGAAGGNEGSGHWHVFDVAGVEGYDAGHAAITSSLFSTNQLNSISSTTWFAIPTNSINHALPPTPLAAHLRTPKAHSSTGKLRRGLHSDSRRTGSHLSSGAYTPGAGYTPMRVMSDVNYAQRDSSISAHHDGASSSHTSSVNPQPGLHTTPSKAGRMKPDAAGPTAGHTTAAGSTHQPHGPVQRAPSQRKLNLLFSPVRPDAGDAARPASSILGSRVPPAATVATHGATAAGQHAAGGAFGGSPARQQQQQQLSSNRGGTTITPVKQDSHPATPAGRHKPFAPPAAALGAGPSHSRSSDPLATPRRGQLPPSGFNTPMRSVAGLPRPPGSAQAALPSPYPRPFYRTPNRASRQPVLLGQTPQQQQQHDVGTSGSVFNTWASNVAATPNRGTVDGVLDLLGGAATPGAPGVTTPLYSERLVSSSSDDSDFLDAEDAVPSSSSGGGYFTPRNTSNTPRVNLFGSTGGLAGVRTANTPGAAARGLGTAMPGSIRRTPARVLPVAQVAATPAAAHVAQSGEFADFDDSDDEHDSPIAKAGKSITGVLFTGPDGPMGLLSRSGYAFDNASSSFIHMQSPARAAQQQCAAELLMQHNQQGPPRVLPAGASSNYGRGLAGFSPALSTSGRMQAQQLPPINTQGSTAVFAHAGMIDSDDEVHTPVHSAVYTSPAHTPPEQIMHSHSCLWSSPESSASRSFPSSPIGTPPSTGASGPFDTSAARQMMQPSPARDSRQQSISGRKGTGTPRQNVAQLLQQPRAWRSSPGPPPSPARPLPAVVLVPAVEAAPELVMSAEGMFLE